MSKKLVWSAAILFCISIVAYLFVWPSDLQVTFKTKALPGTVNQSIKLWANGLENSKFLAQEDIQHFSHQLRFNDSIYTYEWNVKALNDSTSQVKVLVTDTQHSLANRMGIFFSETDFEKRTKNTLTNLAKTLKDHEESFKVTILGLDSIPSKYYAYVPLKSTQVEKALKMMENYPYLNTVLSKNKIQLDGAPLIEIEQWSMEKDSIRFNFCYPIIESDNLPQLDDVSYKKIEGKKAIKAIYNGNYITSDRAWYALLNYAENNNLEISPKPIEVFYSNPNMGGDELTWKAEVFLPLKE